MIWMALVLFYGILKGSREFVKKEAMRKNSVMEVIVAYTVLSFIFVIPQAPQAMGMESRFYFWIAIKSFAIFLAWIFGFYSLTKLPVSLFGILDLSRVLFSTFTGVFFLHEILKLNQIAGLAIVCTGLMLLKFKPDFLKKLFKIEEEEKISENGKNKTTLYVIFALLCCMLNAISGFLDKVLMKDISSAQLQFWYMLFLVLYYLVYIIIAKEKIHVKESLKNPWIWLLAILFVIADRSLFLANANPESRISIMTLIKQSGCIVTILAGKFIFHEKNIGYKLICAAVIIAGIVVAVL